MTAAPRIYPFETIYNFRDFGGYVTSDGQPLARGKLFRSAHLGSLSDSELEAIKALDIGLVVDLRYRPERERQPNRFWADGPRAHFEFTPVEGSVVHKIAPHELFIERDLHSAEDARQNMMASYAARPHDPGFKAIFSKTLHHMAETGEPILIHCAAGKDRTGTLAALILSALGVDRDTIFEDFMLTMTAVDIDAIIGPASQMMSERYGRSITAEHVRPMFGVEPDYLKASFEAMGDVEAYLADELGIGDAERDTLRLAYMA